jgi:hypothetical protein
LQKPKLAKSFKKVIQQKSNSKKIKKLDKSIERLVDGYRKFNQEFVLSLIPLKIYVPVVTSILEYGDELMVLKSRSLNVLYEITPDFKNIELGVTYVDGHRLDKQLTKRYSAFIEKMSEVLNELKERTGQKATQTYLHTAILLLTKLICADHQAKIQYSILPHIYVICKTSKSTLLSCSGIMFITSCFDEFRADITQQQEDFINEVVINQGMANLKKVLPGGEENSQYYANSVIYSVLESYTILMKSMYKFFTPEQLTEVLSVFFSIPGDTKEGEKSINGMIDKICNLIAKNISPRISLHAVFNSFDFIANKPQVYTASEPKLKIYCQRYFSCLGKVFRGLKKDFIEEFHTGIAKFMNKCFLIVPTWEANTGEQINETEQILNPILLSFRAFILKLNELQLKPLFLRLVKWAKKPVDKTAEKPIKNLDRVYVFFRAVNTILETLMSIFSPYMTYYIDLLTEIFNINIAKLVKRQGHEFLDPENHRLSIVMLINSVLECIRLNYYFDTESTIPVEYFERVSDSMLSIMDFYISKGTMNKEQYLLWISDVYQPTIVDVLSSMDSDQISRSFLEDLLQKSKHDIVAVRLASMKITEALLYKLEERFLTLLSDIIPFISEAFEDTDEEVEQTARSIIQKIESMTGESIEQYLK